MISSKSLDLIKQSPGQLKKPVRLVLFTTATGSEDCREASDLARSIKAHLSKLSLEAYDIVMDRDKADQYGIKRVPAMVVQDGAGQSITFYGVLEDVFLGILLETIQFLSDTKVWFPADVRRALQHLSHDVLIRVFVESDCPLCRPVAETAIGLAIESSFIATEIIIASDFPELIRKHKITKLPLTIFGENIRISGHVTESEFLEMIFKAEGIKPEPDRRCLVCGTPSPDIICKNCKTRIQAEAIDHKTRIEKGLQQP